MRAFLTIGAIRTVAGANEDRRVSFRGITKVQTAVRHEPLCSVYLNRGESFGPASIKRGFGGEPAGAKKQRGRREPEEVAELTPSNLSFFIAIAGKIGLIMSGGRAHVALVAEHPLDGFV